MTFPHKKYLHKTIKGSKPTITKLQKDVKMLKRVAVPEVKFHDTAITTAGAVTLVINPVSLIAQGDTDATRDGDEIYVKNLYVKGLLAADTGSDGQLIRFLIIQDKQQDADASVFTSTDFLQSDVWNSFYKADGNQKRFKVLSDRVHQIGDNQNGDSTDNNRKYISLNAKINQKMYFNGTAATLSSAGRGKLYVCYICNAGTPVTDLQCRLTFQDS